MKISSLLMLLVICSSTAFAQVNQQAGQEKQEYDVHPSYQMRRLTVWRNIDLKEKANRGFWAKDQELVKHLLDAVQKNQITAYVSDSLLEPLSSEKVMEKLKIGGSEEEDFAQDGGQAQGTNPGSDWIEEEEGTNQPQQPQADYIFAQDITLLELKEHVIFDKQHSQRRYDIQALTLWLPAGAPGNLRPYDVPIASFSYDDMAKLFNRDPSALWYNTQNQAQHKSLTTAFELRLFSSRITKMANAQDESFAIIHGDQELMASYNAEQRLVDQEAVLWSY